MPLISPWKAWTTVSNWPAARWIDVVAASSRCALAACRSADVASSAARRSNAAPVLRLVEREAALMWRQIGGIEPTAGVHAERFEPGADDLQQALVDQRENGAGPDAGDQRRHRDEDRLQRLLARAVDLEPVEAQHREHDAQQRGHDAHALQQQVRRFAGDPGVELVEHFVATELRAGRSRGRHPGTR